ncbi:MAG: hypothetical protein LC627_01155 [Verrucomicrobiaceae bacterium]|nr:hypothetical protein [Verrucomicrobiaceae bacterium]
MRNIFLILVSTALAGAVTLNAAPTPTPSAQKTSTRNKKEPKSILPIIKMTPLAPLPEGWSISNGFWVHSDGYKYQKGEVIRTGPQTHKPKPKPPTKAQMDAAKKKKGPPTATEAAAAKAVARERNLTPRPAPQTGTQL